MSAQAWSAAPPCTADHARRPQLRRHRPKDSRFPEARELSTASAQNAGRKKTPQNRRLWGIGVGADSRHIWSRSVLGFWPITAWGFGLHKIQPKVFLAQLSAIINKEVIPFFEYANIRLQVDAAWSPNQCRSLEVARPLSFHFLCSLGLSAYRCQPILTLLSWNWFSTSPLLPTRTTLSLQYSYHCALSSCREPATVRENTEVSTVRSNLIL